MKSIFGSAPLLPSSPAPHQHPRTHSNPNAFIETYSAALQGWAEGNAHYEHQRPRWALTWSFEMIGVSQSGNKKLGRLHAAGWRFERFRAGRGGGGGLLKIWRKWVISFCQDVFAVVVDQTPTCCPWSPGPYCRKLQLCCWPYNVPPERCFIEQHSRWENSYNNSHVNLHVMLRLSTPGCCSCILTMASGGLMSGCASVLGDYWELSSRHLFFYDDVWDAEQGRSRTLLPSSAADVNCFNTDNQWQQLLRYEPWMSVISHKNAADRWHFSRSHWSFSSTIVNKLYFDVITGSECISWKVICF